MRTARADLPLANGTRPNSAQAVEAATEGFRRLAEGAEPVGDIRFIGYRTNSDATRLATYEADFE